MPLLNMRVSIQLLRDEPSSVKLSTFVCSLYTIDAILIHVHCVCKIIGRVDAPLLQVMGLLTNKQTNGTAWTSQ